MDELRLDGNTAAGTVEEIFSFEETMAEYAAADASGPARPGEESGSRTSTEANDEP
jgi:hypothetical protein